MKIIVEDMQTSIIWCRRLDCKFCSAGKFRNYGEDMYGKFGSCVKEEIEIGEDGKCKSITQDELDPAEVAREVASYKREIGYEDDGEI